MQMGVDASALGFLDGQTGQVRRWTSSSHALAVRSADSCGTSSVGLTLRLSTLPEELMIEELVQRMPQRLQRPVAPEQQLLQPEPVLQVPPGQLAVRRQAETEMEAAARKHADAEEEVRRLQARVETLMKEQEDVQNQHKEQLDTLRAQSLDLRTRLAEAKGNQQ